MIKKFVPCIYLYRENAVRSLHDASVRDTDPVRLARYYSENNADELIVFDMSETDAEHEAALDVIKEVDFPEELILNDKPERIGQFVNIDL